MAGTLFWLSDNYVVMIYLFIIFLIVLFVGMMVLSAFFSAVSTILSWFGFGGMRKRTENQHYSERKTRSEEKMHSSPKRERGKLFADDEGEYVDFEEIE